MITKHITEQIGPLVIKQVQLEKDIPALEARLLKLNNSESDMIEVYGVRESITEKRQQLNQIKGEIIAFRKALLNVYEQELNTLEACFIAEPADGLEYNQQITTLRAEIERLKAVITHAEATR